MKSKARKVKPTKPTTFDAYLKEQLKNPAFRRGYEKEKQKLDVGYQVFLARERAKMTQAELARRIGTKQSNISRLEFGNYNFTVEMLSKIAQALKADLKIEIKPAIVKKAA